MTHDTRLAPIVRSTGPDAITAEVELRSAVDHEAYLVRVTADPVPDYDGSGELGLPDFCGIAEEELERRYPHLELCANDYWSV